VVLISAAGLPNMSEVALRDSLEEAATLHLLDGGPIYYASAFAEQ
jgi:hypothetical protein